MSLALPGNASVARAGRKRSLSDRAKTAAGRVCGYRPAPINHCAPRASGWPRHPPPRSTPTAPLVCLAHLNAVCTYTDLAVRPARARLLGSNPKRAGPGRGRLASTRVASQMSAASSAVLRSCPGAGAAGWRVAARGRAPRRAASTAAAAVAATPLSPRLRGRGCARTLRLRLRVEAGGDGTGSGAEAKGEGEGAAGGAGGGGSGDGGDGGAANEAIEGVIVPGSDGSSADVKAWPGTYCTPRHKMPFNSTETRVQNACR